MFKKFSSSFKKITLLILFSLSVLLMAINIPTPFGGGGDKISSFDIKQKSLHTNPTETQKQAVWTFLKSKENFEEDWKNEYTSWLDLIKKRKPQKTIQDNYINAVVDLTPLWDVETTSDYSTLTPKVKKVLSDLLKISHYDTLLTPKKVILDTIKFFSFDKETHGAVYDLITTLKANDRWTVLINYQIKKINDVNVESLLLVQNIASLSGNKATYDNFSEPVKVSLRNLLDLDVASSNYFVRNYNTIFTSKWYSTDDILKAFETRIDNVISDITTKAPNLWDFLKASNRLQDIKTRLISQIGNVDVTSLHDVESTTSYDDLSNAAKGTLFDLLQISNYDENTIDTFIQNDKDAQAAWTFLQTNDRLTNVKKYHILPALESAESSTLYTGLSSAQQTALYDLSQRPNYQDNVDDAIINFPAVASNAWTFLTTSKVISSLDPITNIRTSLTTSILKNIKAESISFISDVDISPLHSVESITSYENLGNDVKDTLYKLVQISDYQTKINTNIQKVKQAKNLWETFLTQNDRLTNIKLYKLNPTSSNFLSIFKDININTPYSSLNLAQRKNLYKFSSYDRNVIDTLIPERQTAATNAWTFLKTSNRLADIKQYQINTIDTVTLLPVLRSVLTSTSYTTLTFAQKNAIYDLSQKTTYQKTINDLIQKDQDAENVWTFLRNENRLANLKKYEIKIINGIALLPLLPDITLTKQYPDLSLVQKTTLYTLSQLENYQVEIQKILGPRNAWKILQTNNYLKQLQTNKTLKTKKFDLSILAKIKPNTKYEDLTPKQIEALDDLSKLANFQNEIKKVINESITTKTEDDDNLLWLWITLPLVLVSLIFGLGFYLYRFKKLSIFKSKKSKK